MPTRWFVPLDGLKPLTVRAEHLHAAFSHWFDQTTAEHAANDKPYTVSRLTSRRGRPGVEITTLSEHADRLLAIQTSPGRAIRLGARVVPLAAPDILQSKSWAQLEAPTGESAWTLEFTSPTTFRSGNRSSPLPAVPTIMAGLSRAWNAWSDRPRRSFDPRTDEALWVSDLNLTSELMILDVRDRHSARKAVHLACVTGTMTLRCDDPATAQRIAPLIRLAPFAGVGSMRTKGFGGVRLQHDRNASRTRRNAFPSTPQVSHVATAAAMAAPPAGIGSEGGPPRDENSNADAG